MILDLGGVANRSPLSLPLIGVSVLVLVGVVIRLWTASIGWICGSDKGGPGGNCVRGLLRSCACYFGDCSNEPCAVWYEVVVLALRQEISNYEMLY